MHGKVHVWKMTEEERLAYIKKHPIIPNEKERVITFSSDIPVKKNTVEKKNSGNRIIDSVDKVYLHRMFMAGEKLDYIAKKLKISTANLNNYIKEQRKIDPEKWPHRLKRK